MYLKNGDFLFNPSECENCRHLVSGWDWDKHEETILRPYANHSKNERLLIYDFFDFQLIRFRNPRYIKNPKEDKWRDNQKECKREIRDYTSWN